MRGSCSVVRLPKINIMSEVLPKTSALLEELRQDGRLDDHQWFVADKEMHRVLLGVVASLMRRSPQPRIARKRESGA